MNNNMIIPKLNLLGNNQDMSISYFIKIHKNEIISTYQEANPDKNEPTLLGFFIPPFQRSEVWTIEQKQKLIESLFLGFPIGRIIVSINYVSPETDGWLIDGQQRLSAIRDFFDNQFSIFNNIYFEDIYNNTNLLINNNPKKNAFNVFKNTYISCLRLDNSNKQELLDLYTRLNFGGTSHTEEDRPRFN